MRYSATRSVFVALPLLFAGLLTAQDTRKVIEPKIPTACTVLKAEIALDRGMVAAQDEHRLDTARIQQAMDKCARGKAVVLRADGTKNTFLSGPLTLRSGVALVVDANTVLGASRDPRVYDLTPGSCGVLSEKGHGCKPLIFGDGIENSAIMGNGAIDGRGGAQLLGQEHSWWDLAHEAQITHQNQNVPWLVIVRHAKNFTLYNITLRNSPMFHVSVGQSDGFTAWGVKVYAPMRARNTDGIDPGSSKNVTITKCFIHTGDDNVAVKSSAAGAAENISVIHNHFYTGHGMSIGSGTDGGVNHLLVDDLTIDGADNGIRIKSDRSRGGLVQNALYRNVCIRDTRNPLMFTPFYVPAKGDLLPVYKDITLENVHILSAGAYSFFGLDADHKLEVKLDNVTAEDQEHSQIEAANAVITIAGTRNNLTPNGKGVALKQASSTNTAMAACEARFIPFPDTSKAPEILNEPRLPVLHVAADGSAKYKTVQEALEAAPAEGGALILLAPGTYREVLTVDKPNIHVRGTSKDASATVIVNDRNARENGGTSHSATVNVTADDFYAEDLTIENDYNKTHTQASQGSQAVALFVTGDRAVFHHVRLLGNQDTLYSSSRQKDVGCTNGQPCPISRQYFSDCYIAGNVDFIFGNSKTVFDRCELHSTAHGGGFLTAHSAMSADEDSGYVFNHCRLTADTGLTGKVYLGRPWRPYAKVTFLNTEMGDHIAPTGWSEWKPGTTHSIETATYSEYNSFGPGAHLKERDPHTKYLTEEQVKQLDPTVYLRGKDNWNPLAVITKGQ